MVSTTFRDVKAEQDLAFRLLLGYRWISLLPPLIWLALLDPASAPRQAWLTLALVAGLTLLLSLTATAVNRLLLRQPWLLVFDLLLSAGLVWSTGVERSPYYFYSLVPILAAAFFFRIRGGLLVAAIYTLFYVPLVFLAPRPVEPALNLPNVVGQVISFFLIGTIFGYPSLLLQRLRQAHAELEARNRELSHRNRDLDLLHDLALIMQSSVDPAELQEYILQGLVQEMGYRRAVIGLYDERRNTLTGWITLADSADAGQRPRIAHTDTVSLDEDGGPLARALRSREIVEVLDGASPTGFLGINDGLQVGQHYIVLPLSLREHLLGIILVDGLPPQRALSPIERLSLERLAAHAGVALGSVRLCIDRAQREAITEERNRIAVELHDSISQILYGLAYGLDACIQLLPGKPTDVRQALTQLYPKVVEAQAQMREAIFNMWLDEITSDAFVARLHRHLRAVCPTRTIALQIELPGDFDRWEAATRGHLYRIAQEALANAAKHASARQVIVAVSHSNGHIELHVEDDGRGFNPANVDRSQHLGIQGMTDYTKSVGGQLEVCSQPGRGTVVTAKVPYTCA